MAKFKVVIAELGYASYEPERQEIEAAGGELVMVGCSTEGDLLAACHDADGIIVRHRAPVTAQVISALDQCKVIARYGVGVDNIDLAAATRKGICVCNVPDYCQEEVSDQAWALLMACARKTAFHDRRIRRGEWDISSKDPIHRIAGKTLGLIGLGAIARRLARKAAGWELRIMAYDPYVSPKQGKEVGAEIVDLDTVLKESDFISLHAPSTPETRHIINAVALKKMKNTAILVNTSRGPLVDEEALYEALRKGEINSAGLDVFDPEPLASDNPLRTLNNLVISDHAGWYSEESQLELQTKAAQEVVLVLTGHPPRSLVNQDVL